MPRHNLYMMNVDCRRNYYNCRGFKHIERNYRNWRRIRQRRKANFENNQNKSNLNRKEDLIVFS